MVFGIALAFSSLVKSVFEILRRPQTLLPALLIALVNFSLILLLSENYYTLVLDIATGSMPDIGILQLPYYFISTYFFELLSIKLLLFANIAGSVFLLFVYSKMLGTKRNGVIESIGYALGRIAQVALISIFVIVSVGIFFALAFLLFAATLYSGTFGIVFLLLEIVLFLAGLYVFTRLAFTPLFMFFDELNVKKALAQSWNWSSKKVLMILFFMTALTLIVQLIAMVFELVSDIFENQIELSVLIVVIGLLIVNAYSSIATVKYFLEARK